MVALIILGVLVLIIAIICLTSVGAEISYEDEVLRVRAKINRHYLQLYPKPPDDGKKPKKEKKKKDEPPQEAAAEEEKAEKPSLLASFSKAELWQLVKTALSAVGRFRRKLLINRFKLWFISSSSDPYVTIQVYNYANEAVCILGALCRAGLNIKHSDVRIATDFEVGKPYFEGALCLSIRIGQVLWIGIVTAVAALKILLRHKKEQKAVLKQQLKEQKAA